jgi:hypothetical protein
MPVVRWDLRLYRHAAERVALATPPSYETIVDLLVLDMELLCCHWQASELLAGFERAVLCIRVARPAFDWFFNSRNGYRAAYFASDLDGERANRRFLETVVPELLSTEQARANQPNRLRESLLAPSAHVWLAEAEKGPLATTCPSCREGWSASHLGPHPEIQNDRAEWVTRNDGRGSRAPYADRLRIFGAFIDDDNSVFVPWNERRRAADIRDTGWF